MGLRRAEPPNRFFVDADDDVGIASVAVTESWAAGRSLGFVQPTRGLLLRVEDTRSVGTALDQLADSRPGPLDLIVLDELLRDDLRRRGWTGPLRGLLTATPGGHAPAGGWDAPTTATLPARIEELLTDATVTRRRSFRRRALSLDVTGVGDRTVQVKLPERDDVMAESVAAAVDTLLAIRRRFGRRTGVHRLDFDNGGRQFTEGTVSGTAEGGSGVAVLNPNLVVAGEMAADRLRHRADLPARFEAPHLGQAPPGPPRPVPYSVDEVTAHECWHFMQAGVLTSAARYTELHRALGEALGVESLELALRGAEPDAPESWRLARDRLVREVSAYAATSANEAHAEMFARWWCDAPGRSTLVDTFGALVDRYLPPV